MRISLYFDEDSMDKLLVRALRARRVDVATALEAEMIRRADEEHLDFASSRGRVLYSVNVGDFYRIHTRYLNEGKSHAGIVLAQQQQYSVREQMRRLLSLIAQVSVEEMRNRLEFLSAWSGA